MGLRGALKAFTTISSIWFYLFIALQAKTTEAKIGYFWHITDLHFDSFYTTKGDVHKSCWDIGHHQSSTSRTPGRFGDYLCDSPWSLLESATEAMKSRQGDNVEFVLWTGDGLSHSSRRLIEKSRIEHLRNITELLRRTFPSQFVFPVLGHEDGQNVDFQRLGDLWRNWLPSEAVQTFERGGYYTIEQTKSRLRIVALNTNFMRHDGKHSVHSAAVRQRPVFSDTTDYNNYYHHQNNHHMGSNNGYYSGQNSGGTVSALSGAETHESQKQWEWLEEVLAKSNRNKETVYIVGHIPPGSDERQVPNGHTLFTEKNNLRYLRLVRKYSSIIQGQFFGHLHSDSFRIIYSDMGKPVSWMMVAPSVTPRKMSVGSNNPAMRLYKFETDTGQVLDYTQYYLDLAAANIAGEASWQAEYNLTTHYYGLGEVTSVALHNLADRFTNPDDPLFVKYYRANSVRYLTQTCDSVCALNHYCAITRVDYNEIRQCLETAASALASNSHPNKSNITKITFILPFFLLFKYQLISIFLIIINIKKFLYIFLKKFIKHNILNKFNIKNTIENIQKKKNNCVSTLINNFSNSQNNIKLNFLKNNKFSKFRKFMNLNKLNNFIRKSVCKKSQSIILSVDRSKLDLINLYIKSKYLLYAFIIIIINVLLNFLLICVNTQRGDDNKHALRHI